VTSVLKKPTVCIWFKKMLGGQKFASDTKVQLVIRLWLGQQPASFFCIGRSEACWQMRQTV